MNKPNLEENSAAVGPAAEPAKDVHDPIYEAEDQTDIIATAATVAVVGVAVFEAALLPGVVLGAAMLVPKVLPNLGTALSPWFRSTGRGFYRLPQEAPFSRFSSGAGPCSGRSRWPSTGA
jgi:hypothetical protein